MKRRRTPVRRFKRRYSRRPRSTADGTYTEKLTYETELYVQAGATYASLAIHWARSGNGAANEIFAVGTTPGNLQFKQCATMWKSYKITGMKMEYRPFYI